MNLPDTVNKLGHPEIFRTKKATNAVFKPVNTAIAVSAISAIMSIGNVQGQEVTKTGYGDLYIYDENQNEVAGATITWTPVYIPGDSIPDPYIYTSDNEGVSPYEVLVFHDTGVGTPDDYNIDVVQARPNPSSDFTFNFIAHQRPNNPIEILNFSGQLVGQFKLTNYANQVAVYHVDLSDKPNGFYIAKTTIDGKSYSSKVSKIGSHTVGNLGSSAIKINNNVKSAQEEEAIYEVTIEADNYFTITDQRTVTEGLQEDDGYIMVSTVIPIPQHQDIQGIAKDEANNNGPKSGVTAILYNQTTNQTMTKVTGSDGKFTFENIPTGSTCFISVGGVSGYYSFNDIEYTVPSSIDQMSDTIMTDASAIMYTVRPEIFQFNVLIEQTNNGTLKTERLYWFAPSVITQNIPIYNAQIAQYDAQTNDYTHTRTFDENEADIKIYEGAFNTTSNTTTVSTPFGDRYPVAKSFMYLGTNSYGSTAHELGQADGKDQCSGSGYLSSNPPATGPDAQDIAIGQLEKLHWVDNVYTNGETYFDLNKLSETLNNKSPAFKASQID